MVFISLLCACFVRASSYVSSKVGRFGMLLACVSVVVYCFSCSGVDIYRSSRVVDVICASSMSPSSSYGI